MERRRRAAVGAHPNQAEHVMQGIQNNPVIIDKIIHEHSALRGKLGRIHSALAEPIPAPEEVENLLKDFLNALIVHFAHEEDEGFFDEVSSRAPQLGVQAARLCVEHKQLLRETTELCQFATAGSPSMVWWRELRSRCHDLSKKLMRHESEENLLLQHAHQDDVGVSD
jgi:hypothetical protein